MYDKQKIYRRNKKYKNKNKLISASSERLRFGIQLTEVVIVAYIGRSQSESSI